VESRLTALIVRIGDKSASSLEANLQGLAEALEGDLAHHGPQITNMLFNWYAHYALAPFCFVVACEREGRVLVLLTVGGGGAPPSG
jgi:hypothetical protein